jgi:hypothetical protein
MPLKNYLHHLLTHLDNHPFLESRELAISERPPDAAFIQLTATFIDGSKLNFKEFIIFGQRTNRIIKYGYNYLSEEDSLVFRYDNAFDPATRHLPSYPEHKHTQQGVTAAHRCNHDELFEEIKTIIGMSEPR